MLDVTKLVRSQTTRNLKNILQTLPSHEELIIWQSDDELKEAGPIRYAYALFQSFNENNKTIRITQFNKEDRLQTPFEEICLSGTTLSLYISGELVDFKGEVQFSEEGEASIDLSKIISEANQREYQRVIISKLPKEEQEKVHAHVSIFPNGKKGDRVLMNLDKLPFDIGAKGLSFIASDAEVQQLKMGDELGLELKLMMVKHTLSVHVRNVIAKPELGGHLVGLEFFDPSMAFVMRLDSFLLRFARTESNLSEEE